MKTTWFNIIAERKGHKADPNHPNVAMLKRHQHMLTWYAAHAKDPLERAGAIRLMEFRDSNVDIAPDLMTGSEVFALKRWIETFPVVSETSEEGDDRHAGNRIPTVSTFYTIEGHKFEVKTEADWDNYQEDCFIYMDDELVAEFIR